MVSNKMKRKGSIIFGPVELLYLIDYKFPDHIYQYKPDKKKNYYARSGKEGQVPPFSFLKLPKPGELNLFTGLRTEDEEAEKKDQVKSD